jgi:hypothetical protein
MGPREGGGALPVLAQRPAARRPVPPSAMSQVRTERYLTAYPPDVRSQVRVLIAKGRLADSLEQRYPERHAVASDSALYDYVSALNSRHLRNAGPLAKVLYDDQLHLTHQALGTHTGVRRAGRQSQVQARDSRRQPLSRGTRGSPEENRCSRTGTPQRARTRQGVLRPVHAHGT